jgi:hypothetical protein
MDRSEQWKSIVADLTRARNALHATSEMPAFTEFVDNNELELACYVLEDYARNHPVPDDFWLALRDAAAKMNLADKAEIYEAHVRGLDASCSPG